MNDKKQLKIQYNENLYYVFEEYKDMIYAKKDKTIISDTLETASLFTLCLPKSSTSFYVTHDKNVKKELIKISKALLVFAIIFLILALGLVACYFLLPLPFDNKYALIGAGVLALLSILFFIIYGVKKRKKEYRVVDSRIKTDIQIFNNGAKVFSVEFDDDDQKIYDDFNKFINDSVDEARVAEEATSSIEETKEEQVQETTTEAPETVEEIKEEPKVEETPVGEDIQEEQTESPQEEETKEE